LIFVFKIWHIIIASALAKDGLTTYTEKLRFVLVAYVFLSSLPETKSTLGGRRTDTLAVASSGVEETAPQLRVTPA
jgi:hypothetical protein